MMMRKMMMMRKSSCCNECWREGGVVRQRTLSLFDGMISSGLFPWYLCVCVCVRERALVYHLFKTDWSYSSLHEKLQSSSFRQKERVKDMNNWNKLSGEHTHTHTHTLYPTLALLMFFVWIAYLSSHNYRHHVIMTCGFIVVKHF